MTLTLAEATAIFNEICAADPRGPQPRRWAGVPARQPKPRPVSLPLTWPDCCKPVVARGSRRDGTPIAFALHSVACDEPLDRRRTVGPLTLERDRRRSTRIKEKS